MELKDMTMEELFTSNNITLEQFKNEILSRFDQQAKKIAKLEADNAAIRELMNTYNLGGWTDAIEPMKRALKAEAKIAVLEKQNREVNARLVSQEAEYEKVKKELAVYKEIVKSTDNSLGGDCLSYMELAEEFVKLRGELAAEKVKK
jgi:hypothetical protein